MRKNNDEGWVRRQLMALATAIAILAVSTVACAQSTSGTTGNVIAITGGTISTAGDIINITGNPIISTNGGTFSAPGGTISVTGGTVSTAGGATSVTGSTAISITGQTVFITGGTTGTTGGVSTPGSVTISTPGAIICTICTAGGSISTGTAGGTINTIGTGAIVASVIGLPPVTPNIGLATFEETPEIKRTFSKVATATSLSINKMANVVLNGAHSRPLSRRVGPGEDNFWLGGDWGRDEHGGRKGNFGFAEVGLGRNLGPVQINAALGQTWSSQTVSQSGKTTHDGTYLFTEGLLPIEADASGGLWAVISGYYHEGNADIRRDYVAAGVSSSSTGHPDSRTYGVGARLQWDKLIATEALAASPHLEVTYASSRLDAYRETGGTLPAIFSDRKQKSSELRAGIDGERALSGSTRLIGTLDATHVLHKSETTATATIPLFFSVTLPNQTYKRNWLRAGLGLESGVGSGIGSVMINATTQGEMPSYWIAASWRTAF